MCNTQSIEYWPRYSWVTSRHLFIGLILLLASAFLSGASTEEEFRVQKIKAAYLYNFLLLNEWPPEKLSASEGTITIGILGNGQTFVPSLFEPIMGDVIEGRRLIVKWIKYSNHTQELKKCHVLFIAKSAAKDLGRILEKLKNSSVLTVSEMSGFIEIGGMIQFVEVGNRIRFQINNAAIKAEKIWISSQVLRLAVKIIEE